MTRHLELANLAVTHAETTGLPIQQSIVMVIRQAINEHDARLVEIVPGTILTPISLAKIAGIRRGSAHVRLKIAAKEGNAVKVQVGRYRITATSEEWIRDLVAPNHRGQRLGRTA